LRAQSTWALAAGTGPGLDRRTPRSYGAHMQRRSTVALALAAWLLLSGPGRLCAQDPDAGDLATAQRALDKGELTSAEHAFQELVDAADEGPVDERPSAAIVDAARVGLLEIGLRRGRYEAVIEGIGALGEQTRTQLAVQGWLARAHRALGHYEKAAELWQARVTADDKDIEARCELGAVQQAMGQLAAARATWTAAIGLPLPSDPEQLAWHGRCRFQLGGPDQVVPASEELVQALQQQPRLWRARVTLGVLRLQVYGEARNFPSGEKALSDVLEQHGDVEEALLWLYRLRSSNFNLDGGKTERYLQRLLAQNPRSVAGIVLRGAGVLDDRRYHDAAAILDEALAIDARDKDALAHRAACALLLHDDAGYGGFRTRALAGDAGQSFVDRIIGDHLAALYRFADAQPYYEAALAADGKDVDALQGMARTLIYTGQGAKAKELLLRAKDLEPGYVDPWRVNALAAQALLDEQYTAVDSGVFHVTMHKEDEEVLAQYLLPLCAQALEVLGKKYDYRPQQQVSVEVFHTWDDFSVRTIGFRGFTALGACFGPLITMVSPGDGDLRKQDFMWEATAWHEYTHVLTLGLSKHRVPRWLTEGFSVHEEKAKDPSWERGMDRELFDAFHNQDIPPVRLLNRLFRGERILFGYYQGGLIVDLIARDSGFAKAIELLRAFGDDLDTEAAFERALGMSSAEFDKRFLEFVERDKLRGMRLVPRYDDAALQRLLVKIAQQPDNMQVRVDLAWAFVQRHNPVDAGPHLAQALARDPEFGSALLVRAALLAARGDAPAAIECWQHAFARGADDFDSRIACGRALAAAGDTDGAEQMYQRAKACWPNCTEQDNAPELLLAKLYRDTDRRDMALMEMKSYCKRTARAYVPRWTLAGFERDAGNRAVEAEYLEQCNRIDPFRRELHERLGAAFEATGKNADAAREYEVGAAVPPSLDRAYLAPNAERPAAGDPKERADRGRLWLQAAHLRWALGDKDRARALLQRILRDAGGSEAATAAQALVSEWRAQ
jgi:tetratricopeptide (TPR) repeat protein